jgi:hypothetical protein
MFTQCSLNVHSRFTQCSLKGITDFFRFGWLDDMLAAMELEGVYDMLSAAGEIVVQVRATH